MAKRKRHNKCKLLPFEVKPVISIQDAKQKSGWEITAFNLPDVWHHTQGEGVIVAVLDTGIDTDHEDLINNLLPGINILDPNSKPEDDNMHGCVHPDTYVHTNFYGIERIETLYEKLHIPEIKVNNDFTKDIRSLGIKICTLNKTSELQLEKIEFIHKIKIKTETIKILLKNGESLELTPWHPLYLINENEQIHKKEIKDINLKDIILSENGKIEIYKIEKKYYDGYFYDFTIKNSHTYLANGIFVSNTHVAGIVGASNNAIGVVGVAPKAKILPIKILDRFGNGNFDNVAKGIRAAIGKADIMVMSLGCPTPLATVRKAIQEATKKGIPIFCAAGNAGNIGNIFYPARYPETIAIGGIDANFKRANFSNTGENLDFMAPAVDILSTVPQNWYAVLSGTSQGAPFAAGIAALALSYVRNNKTNIKLNSVDDYRNLFKKHTLSIKDTNVDKYFQGFGIINPSDLENWFR